MVGYRRGTMNVITGLSLWAVACELDCVLRCAILRMRIRFVHVVGGAHRGLRLYSRFFPDLEVSDHS